MLIRDGELPGSYDVLIVGLGPAGAGTAMALTGSGLGTVILERAPLPRDKVLNPGGRYFNVIPEK